KPAAWRSFDLITKIEIEKPQGRMQAWIPIPSVNEADWFRSGDSKWTGNATVTRVRDPKYGAEMLHAVWKEGETAPAIEVTSRVSMRDRAIDFSKPGKAAPLSAAE